MSAGLSIGLGIGVGILLVLLAVSLFYNLYLRKRLSFSFMGKKKDGEDGQSSTRDPENGERNLIHSPGSTSQLNTADNQNVTPTCPLSRAPSFRDAIRAQAEMQRKTSATSYKSTGDKREKELDKKTGSVRRPSHDHVYENFSQRDSPYENVCPVSPSSSGHHQPPRLSDTGEEESIYEELPPEGIILASDI